MKYLLFILASSFLFASCDKGVVYSHNAKVEDQVWSYGDMLEYDVESLDTTQYYELVVQISFDKDFSYQNFYTKITTQFPSGLRMNDVVSFQLADKMGSWVADCGSKTCEAELILQDGFRFREKGKHQIVLENYSREELQGIHSIRLKLYDTSQM